MKDDLWARVRGLGSITWKGCDWVELLVVHAEFVILLVLIVLVHGECIFHVLVA